MKTRIAINTLGCKTNQAESASIISQFDPNKIELVDFDQDADIYIVNTCTVTNRTDYKSRYLIRKALAKKSSNPEAKVIVTGCYAQRSEDEVYSLGEVDLVVDNQHKLDIEALLDKQGYEFCDIMQAEAFNFKLQNGMIEHTRAFQKIQDGCDYYCSYCAVPYGRGHNRSARLSDVLLQAKTFVDSGYKEIVLGGVNLGLWRDGTLGLADLLKEMECIPGLELVRLSSLEPQLFTDKLINQIADSSIVAPHFHLALQSCSDTVLKRMNRVYKTELVSDLLQQITSRIPDAAIGADIICGFPGETEEEFAETYSFIQNSPLAYLHVFSYSKRKGTPAAAMPDQITGATMKRRSQALHRLNDKLKCSYMSCLVKNGARLRGVVETATETEASFLSDHYIRAYTTQSYATGELASIIAKNFYKDGLSD